MSIPVTVLTGFLGSGKTTLLNRLLRAPAMKGAVVVVNEFGEIGIDHVLIEAGGETVVLLENGCLCCAVRGELVETLADLLRRRARLGFDRVAIETSGLADPSAVIQVLAAPSLSAYRVGAVIATVDAVNAGATLDAHAEAVRQVALADNLVLTKLDLVAEAERAGARAALEARLRNLNPMARMMAAAEADIAALVGHDATIGADAPDWLFSAPLRVDAPPVGEHAAVHHHGPHEGTIRAFAIVRDEPVTLDLLRLFLDALAQNVGVDLLRLKALVNVAEHPQGPAVLHGAQRTLHPPEFLPRWPDADRRSRFVFVTNGIERAEIDDMLAVLDRMAARAARARQAPAGWTQLWTQRWDQPPPGPLRGPPQQAGRDWTQSAGATLPVWAAAWLRPTAPIPNTATAAMSAGTVAAVDNDGNGNAKEGIAEEVDPGAFARNPAHTLPLLYDSLGDLGGKVTVDLAQARRP